MHSKLLLLCWIAIASCAEPVTFDRDNTYDPGNPAYTPHPPMNLTLSRSGRDMLLRWFVFPGGSDSVWIQKSIQGSDFVTIAMVNSTAIDYRDTTHNLGYPAFYRLRSAFYIGSEIRFSESSDVNLPEPISGVPAGEPVGVFSQGESGIGGTISNLSSLYDRRIRYESPEYGLTEYANYASTVRSADGRDEVFFMHQRLFQRSSCPFIVDATLELTLPSTDGDRLVQEHPIAGSPFTIPYLRKAEQFDDASIFQLSWYELRSCLNCVVNVQRSTDQGGVWTFLEQVPFSNGAYENTYADGRPWYLLSLSCGDKLHPQTIEYQF